MDESLQRLLDAEMRAEKIAEQAEQERERIIQGALLDARAQEELFEARIPELHASFVDKATIRADQTIAEYKKHYDELHARLRKLAEDREDAAVNAAFSFLMDPEADH